MTEDHQNQFREDYFDTIKRAAECGDVWPLPLLLEMKDGSTQLHAVALSTGVAIDHAAVELTKGPTAFAFGVDRFTRPEQGTELGNVFTFVVFFAASGVQYWLMEYEEGEVRDPRPVHQGDFWYSHMGLLWRDLQGAPAEVAS